MVMSTADYFAVSSSTTYILLILVGTLALKISHSLNIFMYIHSLNIVTELILFKLIIEK